jgi:AcrR family transcriptional regulator
MTAPHPPPAPSPATTRERILAAARSVLLDPHPERATMDTFARRAGMSKKTLYREFRSQFELLAALIFEATADLPPSPPPARPEDIEPELTALVERLVRHVTQPGNIALARLIISEIRRYPNLIDRTRDKPYPRRLLAAWLDAPLVRAHYEIGDADDAAEMLLAMVLRDAAFRLVIGDATVVPPAEIDRRSREAVAIFLRGRASG